MIRVPPEPKVQMSQPRRVQGSTGQRVHGTQCRTVQMSKGSWGPCAQWSGGRLGANDPAVKLCKGTMVQRSTGPMARWPNRSRVRGSQGPRVHMSKGPLGHRSLGPKGAAVSIDQTAQGPNGPTAKHPKVPGYKCPMAQISYVQWINGSGGPNVQLSNGPRVNRFGDPQVTNGTSLERPIGISKEPGRSKPRGSKQATSSQAAGAEQAEIEARTV